MKQKLEHQVAAAVGGILAGLREIALEEVADRLPAHIKAANPSLKSVTKALVSAGWVGIRLSGGRTVYRPADREPDDIDPEHNGSDEGSVAADEVRILTERVERLIEERKGIGDDIKDVWAEAKGRGYDPKAMKKVVQLRARKPEERQDEEAILEVYLRVMGMMD